MADEITITNGLLARKGNLDIQREREVQQIDMAGDDYDGGTQLIGFAAHEALALKGDFGTGGWAEFYNLDATNFVQIGVEVAAAFYPVVKLLAGERCVFPVAVNTLFLKADTGAVRVEFTILER
jgi:hypothetical protein